MSIRFLGNTRLSSKGLFFGGLFAVLLLSFIFDFGSLAQTLPQPTTEERLGSSPSLQNDTSPPAAVKLNSAPETKNSPSSSENPTSELLDHEEIAKLRTDIDTIKNLLYFGGSFLAFILFVLTFQSSILAWMSNHRTSEAHSMAMKGERAEQQRAKSIHDKFFEDSYKTIGLVNSTLQLAVDATANTTRVFEERAGANLKQLDGKARALLTDVRIESTRDLVRDPFKQEGIRSLAQEITLFESNRLFFADKFQLTSECRFILGLASHLSQDYPTAIKEWESIRIDRSRTPLLESLAAYWIAVEHDTLGEFDKAITTFESIRGLVSGVAKYDIDRLIVESTFSKIPIDQAESLIAPLISICENAKKENDSRARTYVIRRLNIALGNILLQVGKFKKRKGEYVVAERSFTQAIEKYRATDEAIDQWALLGLGEALHCNGNLDEALDIFGGKALENAEAEFKRRTERRSQVLAKTAELICCVRVPELKDSIVPVYESVKRLLIEVHSRLTIYSAFQKRNVDKETFEAQLDEFLADNNLSIHKRTIGLRQAARESVL
ncbi:MAG TPA: tetratricopeptide repeat protein [Xanthobacteraceae bacterium]|nr:tetratricopeptide repeat protein [Xanthobacteraceae bacterium]